MNSMLETHGSSESGSDVRSIGQTYRQVAIVPVVREIAS